MSDKIKEFRKQACEWARENAPIDQYENASDEKFAELIVKKCRAMAIQKLAIGSDRYTESHNGALWSVINKIDEHFGVEDIGVKMFYTGKDSDGTVTISYEPDYWPEHSEKYIIRFNGEVKAEMQTLYMAVYALTRSNFDTFRPDLQPNPKTALEQGVAEGQSLKPASEATVPAKNKPRR